MLRVFMVILPVILAYASAFALGKCIEDAHYYYLAPVNAVSLIVGLIMFAHLFRKNT